MECLIKILCERIKLQDNFNNKPTTKEWIVVDADGHNLGRLASKVAMILEVSTSYSPRGLWR
jgi:ribosomal protein L13